MCECGVQPPCMHSMGVLCSQMLGKVTRFLVHHFLPYSLKTGSLTETEAGLVANKPCHPPVSASNSTGIIDMHSYAQLVTRVLRIQTWVFMFVQQALFPTETSSYMERCTATPVYTELGIKPRALCMLGWYSANWTMPPAPLWRCLPRS